MGYRIRVGDSRRRRVRIFSSSGQSWSAILEEPNDSDWVGMHGEEVAGSQTSGSSRMGKMYRHPALKQLKEQQARFAPRERRLEQIDRAEQLLAEIEPERALSLRVSLLPDHGLPSRGGARPGARRRRRPARPAAVRRGPLGDGRAEGRAGAEPVLTVDAVSRRFNVSTRTVTRWRRQGLVARRFIIDGRTKVGFLESSLSRFVAAHRDAGRTGDAVPATDRRGAGRDRPPRPSDGAGRPGRPAWSRSRGGSHGRWDARPKRSGRR